MPPLRGPVDSPAILRGFGSYRVKHPSESARWLGRNDGHLARSQGMDRSRAHRTMRDLRRARDPAITTREAVPLDLCPGMDRGAPSGRRAGLPSGVEGPHLSQASWDVMVHGNTSGYQVGATALIVKGPEAEPLVRNWRRQFDTTAAAGVPAHVTVLYPFLDRRAIDASVIGELQAILAEHRAFDVQFLQCRRFPDALYLAPVPDTQLRALTESIANRWPEAQPYRGQFAEVVPHLTAAHGQEPRVFDKIESELSQRLPITAHVSSVQLLI